MPPRKKTYEAELNTKLEPTIDSQGRFRLQVKLCSGDAERPVVLDVTEDQLEWALKTGREVRLRNAIHQVRREERQRAWGLQRQVSDRNRCIDQLEQRNKEMEQAIDGAHAVAHKDQPTATGQADPFTFPKLESQNTSGVSRKS